MRLLCLLLFLPTLGIARPLNVLLITADDMGLQLGCYGDSAIRTPHLDDLAERGRRFTRAYVAQASCSPSRSAMFTGLYPHTNGQYGLLNANVGFELHEAARGQTIPALLKAEGYRTGIIGKLHVGPEKSFPFDWRARADTRDVEATAGQISAFLKDAGDQPFFLMANFSDPHVHGKPPYPNGEVFRNQYLGVPENPLQMGEVPLLPFQPVEDAQQRRRVTQYYNACMRFDAGVGKVLQALEEAGRSETTLILFVSDHGPPFFRGKTTCYEAGVKVPMIAVWPGVFTAGDVSDALVSTVDLLPTILDAVGAPMPERLHGRSLRSSLEPDLSREFLATEFHYHGHRPFFPRRSIRDDRYKLIHNLRAGEVEPPTRIDGDPALGLSRMKQGHASSEIGKAFEVAADPPEWELYDLQADPWEFHNLAADPVQAGTLDRLKTALQDWREATEDPLLTEEGWQQVAAFEMKKPSR